MANGEIEPEVEVEPTGVVTDALTPYNERTSQVEADHPQHGKAQISLVVDALKTSDVQMRIDDAKYATGLELVVRVVHYKEGVSPEELRRNTFFSSLENTIAALTEIKRQIDAMPVEPEMP